MKNADDGMGCPSLRPGLEAVRRLEAPEIVTPDCGAVSPDDIRDHGCIAGVAVALRKRHLCKPPSSLAHTPTHIRTVRVRVPTTKLLHTTVASSRAETDCLLLLLILAAIYVVMWRLVTALACCGWEGKTLFGLLGFFACQAEAI